MKEENEENLFLGSKNSENGNVFSPGKIRITTLSNNNTNLISNKSLENYKEEIEFLNGDEEEEYDLNMINQKYKENNNEEENEENIDYNNNEQIEKEGIFYNINDNESEEEENDDYNNVNEDNINEDNFNENNINEDKINEDNFNENNNQSFNADKNKKYVEEYIVEEDKNNINMDEDKKSKDNDNYNNNDNNNYNDNNNDNNYDNNNEDNKNDNNDLQNIEEEDGEDEYNGRYNLPLSIYNEKNNIKKVKNKGMNEIENEVIDINNFKEIIDMEKDKNNNIEIKNKEINNDNNDNTDNNDDNDNNDNNDLNSSNKNMSNENDIKKDDILNGENNNKNNKEENKENKDERNYEKKEDKDGKNSENVKTEENYEEYILNILAKLKKNNKLKLNKENILFQNINKKFSSSSLEIKRNITPEKKNYRMFSTSPNLNTVPIEKFYKEKEYNTITVNKSIKFDANPEAVDIPEEIKFGIDDTGNPFYISKFFEKDCNKKLIALIIQKNDKNNFKNNFPVDMKGKVLQKSKDGKYLYKDGEKCIFINDFDVKYPELKMLTQKKYHFELFKNEKEKDKDKDKESSENKVGTRNINVIENGHIINTYISKKNDNNKNGIYNNRNEIDKVWRDNIFNNSNDMKNGNNNIYFKEKEKMELNKDNNNVIKNDNNENNKYKFSNSLSFINEKDNFIEMMNIWRERYGKMKTKYNSYKNSYRNLKYNNYSCSSNDSRMVQRTNSILKMASEKYNRNNNDYNDKFARSELSYTKRYSKIDINKKYNKKYNIFIFNNNSKKDSCNSINISGRNTNNSKILKNKGTINYNYNSYKNNNKISMMTKNILNRNKTNINYGYNSYKTNINFNRQIKDITQNILENKNKYDKLENNKLQNYLTNNIIQNYNQNLSKAYNIQNQNNSVINDYIYKNITKINNKNKSKKLKYSILSNEANEIIKNYNKKQKKNEQKTNRNENSFNKTYNSENSNKTNFKPAWNSFQL